MYLVLTTDYLVAMMKAIFCSVWLLCGVFSVVEMAMVTVGEDDTVMPTVVFRTSHPETDGDLSYTDLESLIESRERLYRHLRNYGVPPDVAQMYVPRGMTVGDIFSKEKDKDHGHKNDEKEKDETETGSTFDPWSIVWYIGSFGGLIAFFLVVSCSEWCCLKTRAVQQQQQQRRNQQQAGATSCPTGRVRATTRTACDTPPPAYHLFAPPAYDELAYGEKNGKLDVFVVPVHAVPTNFVPTAPVCTAATNTPPMAPPEYTSVVMPPT